MKDPSEFATMKRGAILVAPATDPSSPAVRTGSMLAAATLATVVFPPVPRITPAAAPTGR